MSGIEDTFRAAAQAHHAGRLGEAQTLYRQILAADPGHVEALHQLGLLAYQAARPDVAETLFQRAIGLDGSNPVFHSNLGLVLQAQGKLDQAVEAYQRGLALRSGDYVALFNLGGALLQQGDLDEAEKAFRKSLALKPDLDGAWVNLGYALRHQGRLDEAVTAYEKAVALNPNLPDAHYNLGSTLLDQNRLKEAAAAFRRTIALKPDFVQAHINLGNVLLNQGKPAEAEAVYRRALALQPELANARDNLTMGLNYRSDLTPEAVFEAHRHWGARYPAPPAPPARDRDPDRRLKVGYVSGDFRHHAVASFLEPLLKAHDRTAVEVFCYAETPHPDAVTDRLKALADHWLFTVGMSDPDVAARIAADRIDILIDLAGYTEHNRLPVFALKPAPVQATWLGYPNTTGIRAIDYRLVDPITDPAGADAFATEKLVRMQEGFLCYAPPADVPEPAPSPHLAGGFVTFGSFNNPSKLSDAALPVWAAVLAAVPGSKLLLKGRAFEDAESRALFEAAFAAHGVTADRLILRPIIREPAGHLAAYADIDIGLDPFPYNGTTTTFEAVSMGVPVITLSGRSHAGRVGASLLTRLGLADLVAEDANQYIEIAARLAADSARLAQLRGTLRPLLLASPLCDAPAFARRFEGALRTMWKRYCEGQAPAAFEIES